MNAVQQNKLLNAHYTEVLTVSKLKTPGGCFDGPGFFDCEINGLSCFRHGGDWIGMNADLEVCPDPGFIQFFPGVGLIAGIF